eukprot:Partr_v1_DN25160_c0_g1_i1_m76796 putative Adhesion regulating molecule
MATAAQNLFSTGSHPSSGGSRNLVEFKAGKMTRDDNTHLVKADTRKGLLYLQKSEDGLLHFCWKDRKTGTVEDDLIVFPEEADWLRVTQCTTGRVYVLKFKTSSQRLFFWMQDLSDGNDEKLAKRVAALLVDPAAGNVDAGSAADAGDSMEMDEAATAEQTQLMQILQAQGLLSPLREAAANSGSPPAPAETTTNLASVLTPDLLAPVLADADMCRQLFPHIPAGHAHTKEELTAIIRSPQFQQAVESLNHAIESGQHGPLLAELGLDPSVANAPNKVLALLQAIKRHHDNSMNTQ